MSAGESITEALKRALTCGVREEAHFSCGDLEKALMRRLEGTPRKRAEAEGVPRLMPRGVAQQSAPLVLVEARGPRPCVLSVELGAKGRGASHLQR